MAIDLALMLAAAAAFESLGLEAAAYGGLALGMYGEPRETRDADLKVLATRARNLDDARSVFEKQRNRLDHSLIAAEVERDGVITRGDSGSRGPVDGDSVAVARLP